MAGTALRWQFRATAVLLVIVMIFGGGSYSFPPQRLVCELAAAGIVGLAIYDRPAVLPRWSLSDTLIVVAIGLVIAQLVPLPPALWEALPGREAIAATDRKVFGHAVWRPISLDPQRGLQGLAALLPAVAAYLAWRWGTPERRAAMLTAVFVALAISIILALVQQALGIPGFLHLYPGSHDRYPVGFFANRNHQAIFLISATAMAAWRLFDPPTGGREIWSRTNMRVRGIVVAGTGLAAVLALLATGSRFVLAIAAIAVPAIAYLVARAMTAARRASPAGKQRWIPLASAGGVLLVTAGLAVSGQLSIAVQRGIADNEGRYRAWPTTWDAIRDNWLSGTGTGTFRRVYEIYEPVASVHPLWVNHAHSDFLEVLLEYGVAGAAGIVALAIWLALRTLMLVRSERSAGPGAQPAGIGGWLALIAIIAPLAHSAVDYPLRTVTMLTLAFIAAARLSEARPRRNRQD